MEEVTISKQYKRDLQFLKLCKLYAEPSKDPRTKVGAVLVNPVTNMPLGWGYNGFPRGVKDRQEWWQNKELKNTVVLHAEWNAILNSDGNLEGATCYCNEIPCPLCTAALIQKGVKRIVFPKGAKVRPHDELSQVMCNDATVIRDEL